MKTITLGLMLSFLVSCAPGGQSAQSIATAAALNVGCKYSQSEMWNSLQATAEQGASFPSASELRSELVKAAGARGLSGSALDTYVQAYVANYQAIVEGVQSGFAPATPAAWQKALAELEAGVQPTSVHARLEASLSSSLAQLDTAESSLNARCANPSADVVTANAVVEEPMLAKTYSTVWAQLKASTVAPVVGARKVLAVAYQSCDVLKLDPMITATPDVVGIKDLGPRGDGGDTREITSVASVDATDYYIHNQSAGNGSSCFEVRNSPLIYNFGGKPVVTTKSPYTLNFFNQSPYGGPTLGFDCSAFVFSALATSGLKLDTDPKKVLKANQVLAYGSLAFKEPATNGMRCLQKINVTASTSILPGDIVAINGHVIMIDSIGADPFALAAIKSSANCTAANIHPENFDFVITQSAPIKNGIGVNRVRGADYMPESATIRDGLVAYAVASCRAKFGLPPNINSPDLSVVRHSGTKACLATRALTLSHESCVDSCRPL